MFKKLLIKYSKNYRLLQEAAEMIGKEYEQKAYKELCGGALDESRGEFKHKGVVISYSAHSFKVKKNGDAAFCIDVNAKISTFVGIKPSYLFYKTRDGKVYY